MKRRAPSSPQRPPDIVVPFGAGRPLPPPKEYAATRSGGAAENRIENRRHLSRVLGDRMPGPSARASLFVAPVGAGGVDIAGRQDLLRKQREERAAGTSTTTHAASSVHPMRP